MSSLSMSVKPRPCSKEPVHDGRVHLHKQFAAKSTTFVDTKPDQGVKVLPQATCLRHGKQSLQLCTSA